MCIVLNNDQIGYVGVYVLSHSYFCYHFHFYNATKRYIIRLDVPPCYKLSLDFLKLLCNQIAVRGVRRMLQPTPPFLRNVLYHQYSGNRHLKLGQRRCLSGIFFDKIMLSPQSHTGCRIKKLFPYYSGLLEINLGALILHIKLTKRTGLLFFKDFKSLSLNFPISFY